MATFWAKIAGSKTEIMVTMLAIAQALQDEIFWDGWRPIIKVLMVLTGGAALDRIRRVIKNGNGKAAPPPEPPK